MPSVEALERRVDREKKARQQAEALLEQKSLELYNASERLRGLAERTQAILDTAAEGILTINEAGEIESFNRAAERIFETTAKEASGKACTDFLAADWQFLFDAGQYEAESTLEGFAVRANGDKFPVDVSVSELYVSNRLLRTAIVRDTSSRKLLEASLSHARKLESVGHLAAGMAHEINTPMQFIGDNIRFVQESVSDLRELLLLIANIKVDTVNASAVIQQLTRLAAEADIEYLLAELPDALEQGMGGVERVSKIVAAIKEISPPGLEERRQATDINRAIEGVLTVSHSQFRSVADVDTNFEESLPKVTCYANDVNQALLGLIINAAEAIKQATEDQDAVRGTIQIETSHVEGFVQIIIADTGTGIPEEIHEKIFDPFFSTKPIGRGSAGQGLACVYNTIVERHGGMLDFQTEPGEGTTFVVRLPIQPVSTGIADADETQIGINRAVSRGAYESL